ncbi:MAG: AAA family ATPase [Oleispira sp.]|nr:AAA family ATPase [Oleispira sp.]
MLNNEQDWFEILSESDGTLLDEEFLPDLEHPVTAGKGSKLQSFSLNESQFRGGDNRFEIRLPNLSDHSLIQWSGYQLSIRPLSVCLDHLETVHIDGHPCRVINKDDSRLTLEGIVATNASLSIDGQRADFSLIRSIDESIISHLVTQRNANGWLIFTQEKPSLPPHKITDVTKKSLSELSLAHLESNGLALNDEEWTLTIDKEYFILEARGTSQLQEKSAITCSNFPELGFIIESRKAEEKWIQLIENNNSGDDTGKSELDYFFGDNQNVKILDSTQRKNDDGFRILKSRPEERQILLSRNLKSKKNWNSEYPSALGKKQEIRVSVNTSQLKRQKEAINQLMSRPQGGHWPLIHLLQGRDKKHWQNIQPVSIEEEDWIVLNNLDFDGCDRQREFVGKALAAEDFSILDGPPGTGKTTTILELIIQLVLDGKRVLLSASTHAAINNVLERIKENPNLAQHIFPLRIGYESNAIGVEEYHFDNQLAILEKSVGRGNISTQLMVDSSNLVCGTTIGILRLFNDKNISIDNGEPPFDVMIIDECSKTTFQEFLVPARFAKRWVLVGDVRQLSPFTDREQIVANLDDLMLVPPRGKAPVVTLSPAIQEACLWLEELRPYAQPMLVPVSHGVLQALQQELNVRKQDKILSRDLDKILLIKKINRNDKTIEWVQSSASIQQKPWHLYSANLCFIDESILSVIQPLIPNDMLILHEGWHLTHQAMLHKELGTTVKAFKIKRKNYTDTFEIQKELLDRMENTKWSEEICWRLEREYWLRLSANHKQKTGYLTDILERLFPKSVDANGRIHVLKNIAFPSILEALSGDGLAKYKKDNPTTLNQGFTHKEKHHRHTTLTYQHRMHPDISAFPRKQFYPPGVLKDGCQTASDREWRYKRYDVRSIWIDVEGKTFKNVNVKEVQKIINELKVFCEWAEGKKKNNGGEAYDVAVLTFYKGQEKALSEELAKLPGNSGRRARFNYKGISIKLATVDYFQGQEADVVFLSMVNTNRDGFMDSPNRLNVSITRARYQLIIVGHYKYFNKESRTEELRNLASSQGVK